MNLTPRIPWHFSMGWRGFWRKPQTSEESAGDPNPDASPTPGNMGLLCAEFDAARQRIGNRVEKIKSLSDTEILGCGNVLSALVEKVNEHMAAAKSEVASTAAGYEALGAEFVQRMHCDLESQASAAQHLRDLTKGIEHAIESIDELNRMAHLLSINARIEAAHLGEHGRSFTAIADRMSELSQTIAGSAKAVGNSVGLMRTGLLPIDQKAKSLREHTQMFVDAIAAHARTRAETDNSSASGSALENLRDLSNQALSHLQFQDPMVQTVLAIPKDLDLLDTRVRRLLSGETDLEPIDQPATDSEPEPDAGALLLF